MRTFFLTAFLLVGLIQNAASQHASGPVAIKSVVNGVPITMHATSRLTVKSAGDHVVVNAIILADLIDLQRNFSRVVDTLAPPANPCANRRSNNESPIAIVKSGSLWPRDDHLVVFMRGHIDTWSCVPKGKKTAVRWKEKKIAFVEIKVPEIVTWNNVARKKVASQRFHGSLDISFSEKDGAAIALKADRLRMTLGGDERLVTDDNLNSATSKMAQEIDRTLRNVIEVGKLKQALPAELRELPITVVSTRFRKFGGHAIAEIGLEARTRESSKTQQLQQLIAQLSN
jgi:hypothetical protein